LIDLCIFEAMTKEPTLILNARQINQKVIRMTHEIHENHYKEKDLVLVGIEGRGSQLANRLFRQLSEISELTLTIEEIKLNKDKPLSEPLGFTGELKSLKGRSVVLIDDVLNSGKTLMYAARFLLDVDIKSLTIVTLVDRYHRKFPIRPDIVGLTLSTNLREHVTVNLTKGKEAVYLD
jgi:pyrimidine operon attenuation protein/uracil phosphoribosyltransferase